VLTTAAFAIACLAFLSMPARPIGAAWVSVVSLVLVAAVGVVQLIPIASTTLRSIAPLSAKVYGDANAILRLFGRPAIQAKISIAPDDTRVTILQTLSYAALLAAAAILASSRMRRRVMIGVLLASSALHILYSTGTTGADQRLHGTFINPNHFAGYLQIALALAFAVVWRELLHNRERGAGIRDLAQRVEKRAIPLAGPILVWGVIAAGIALTRSRGGILAAAATTVILLALGIAHQRQQGRSSAVSIGAISALIAGALFVAFTTGHTPVQRFLLTDPHDIGADARIDIWTGSIRIFRESPLLGSGLGAFREAYRRAQPRSLQGLVEQAHNDFLQILVTGGWIGAAFATFAVLSMLLLLVRWWLRQEHREESAFALGGIGAITALVLHGLVEFNLSIPAIPATLAITAGIAWASATWDAATPSSRSRPREVPRSPS
jgi:O-antigen ligase